MIIILETLRGPGNIMYISLFQLNILLCITNNYSNICCLTERGGWREREEGHGFTDNPSLIVFLRSSSFRSYQMVQGSNELRSSVQTQVFSISLGCWSVENLITSSFCSYFCDNLSGVSFIFFNLFKILFQEQDFYSKYKGGFLSSCHKLALTACM